MNTDPRINRENIYSPWRPDAGEGLETRNQRFSAMEGRGRWGVSCGGLGKLGLRAN